MPRGAPADGGCLNGFSKRTSSVMKYSRQMSDLNDPRVLFAAERTLLAWSRTSAGLMAFGFLIERAGVVVHGAASRGGALWIGLAFVLVGVSLSVLSAL